MSKYLRSTVETFNFDGDNVIVRLRPISFQDFLRFNSIPVIQDEEGNKTMDMLEVTTLLREIVPTYVENIEGLVDAAGGKIEPAEIYNNAYFAPLISDIGAALIKAGSPPSPLQHAER